MAQLLRHICLTALVCIPLVYGSGPAQARNARSWDTSSIPGVDCRPRTVGASMFTDREGYKGDRLWKSGPSFAELGMGSYLGHLPYGYRLRITYQGRTVVARKLDIGRGGARVKGRLRAIDLHGTATGPLRFPYDVKLVTVVPASCPQRAGWGVARSRRASYSARRGRATSQALPGRASG